MFVGHFAAGLGAKKLAPQINLGLLFIACQLLDLIWPVLVLVGVETVFVDHAATVVTPLAFEYYPWSHSLVMSVVYSAIFGAIGGYLYKSKKAGVVLAAVTMSHWVLDFISHRPDLPIIGEGLKVGLGLWNSLALTVMLEIAMFGAGIFLYLRARAQLSQRQKSGFWVLIGLLLVIYAGNMAGPKPPPETQAWMIAAPALAMWLLVALGYWVDRKPKNSAMTPTSTV